MLLISTGCQLAWCAGGAVGEDARLQRALQLVTQAEGAHVKHRWEGAEVWPPNLGERLGTRRLTEPRSGRTGACVCRCELVTLDGGAITVTDDHHDRMQRVRPAARLPFAATCGSDAAVSRQATGDHGWQRLRLQRDADKEEGDE